MTLARACWRPATAHDVGKRLGAIAVAVILVAATACCSSHPKLPSAVDRTTATAIDAHTSINVSDATLTEAQTTEVTSDWAPTIGLAVGKPISITSTDPIPPAGIRLSRTYAIPLPDGQAATLAYFDDELETWHAVPSTLTPDRRTVSAVVHHLSVWTDITGAVADVAGAIGHAAADAADWAYYQVGKIFDTRVDPPSCTGKPSWVQSTIFIATDRNNSLLFCAGQDPKQPQLVDVKVRVNRGFPFDAYLHVPTSWKYNSTFDQASLDDAIAAAGHLGDTFAQAMGEFAPAGSVVVGAGMELSFGATEQAVRDAGDPTVLTLKTPSTVGFLIALLGQLVGTQLDMAAEGYTAAAIAIMGCYSEVKAARDVGSWTGALTTCVSKADDAVAKQLATFLTKRGRNPIKAGQLAGKIIGRASIYLALLGPAFNTMNFFAEKALPDSAHSLAVFPTTQPGAQSVTTTTLLNAEVPADCRLPAQRLVDGGTTQGSPGEGSINTDSTRLARADFAGLGYSQALTEYYCNAGGVGWPEVLVLIGAQGKLLASYDLADGDEHSTVNTITVKGTTAHIAWDAYEGAGFQLLHHTGDFSYANGKLVLLNHTVEYTASAVAEDIDNAAYHGDRSTMKDPNVVTDAQWSQLVQSGGLGLSVMDPCPLTADTAVCEYEGVSPGNNPHNFMTLTRAPGTIYGWRVTKLDIPTPSR